MQDLKYNLKSPHDAEYEWTEDNRSELIGQCPAETFGQREGSIAKVREIPVSSSGGNDKLTDRDGNLAIPK